MKRVWIYLAITFVITYTIEIIVMFNGGMTTNAGMIAISSIMLVPAIGSIITRLITKEGFSNMYLKPKFKGNIKKYLLAWFIPTIMTIIGALVFFLVFPQNFDITMTQMGENLTQQYIEMGVPAEQIIPVKTLFLSQLAIAVFLGPLLNIVTCMGEELGWRGYLLPKLNEKYSKLKATIITGVIWGLWHAPVIMMGHNYGLEYLGFPYLGIIAMTIFCVFFGAFSAYLTFKTKSAIPAGIAHGGLNSIAAVSIFFMNGTVSTLIGPTPVGILGGIGVIIIGTACLIEISKMEEVKNEV